MMVGIAPFSVVVLFVVFFLAAAALLQWLWNITMPEIFNLKRINYWQAFRLLIIAGLLFGAGGLRYIG